MGSLKGGLAVGTLLIMVLISCMNGLSVAGMAIGCSVALPELLKRNYDRRMISGLIQAGSRAKPKTRNCRQQRNVF